MAKSRRTFTREFKLHAVQLVTVQHLSYAEVGRRLDLRDNQLRRWRQELDAEAATGVAAFPGNGVAVGVGVGVEAELLRLRAENKRLLMERDF
ncbi:MAG: transposase [Planctomycetia bacterium]